MPWNIDTAHTSAEFKVRHMGISNVRGSFSGVTGTVETDDSGKLTSVKASIPVDTISTGNADRDNHLKSADFFDAAQFPTITFESTAITSKGGNDYDVTGNLTIHGVTKSVTLPAEVSAPATDPYGNQKMGAEVELKISRKDFGLTWNAAIEAGGVMVGDTVNINLEVQAVKA